MSHGHPSKIDKKRLIKRFLVKAILFYIIWQILFIFYIKPNAQIDAFLTNSVISATVIGLKMLGFGTYSEKNIISIDKTPVLRVENECNGLELLALFVGFIVCFPGRIKMKIPYIIIGCILLYLINIIRVVVLGLNYFYSKATFEINHKYTYSIIVYFLVFLIWRHWIKNYSAVSKYNVQNIKNY